MKVPSQAEYERQWRDQIEKPIPEKKSRKPKTVGDTVKKVKQIIRRKP